MPKCIEVLQYMYIIILKTTLLSEIDNIIIYRVPLNHDALQCAPCQVY